LNSSQSRPIRVDKTVQDGPTGGSVLEIELPIARSSEVSERAVERTLVFGTSGVSPKS
jgi:hypothetical protein